ncbi:MAG: acyl-CoA dehydrogenase family protein [Syntrophales bacterium]|jgi:acyl-CoA dehydrogenase|nr:acyl-CoA dehydrogenase family protein [Syntrophales bacterium]MDY0043201.1 acyl-CoA dehydrogenase family protein [Syntrophales bacterium]
MDPAYTDFNAYHTHILKFVNECLLPIEAEVDATHKVPSHIIDQMRTLRLFGLSIPKKYGGLDLSMEEISLISMAVGRSGAAFSTKFGINIGLGSRILVKDGTEEQKEKYLPRIASGEDLAAFALTEPEAGSDAINIKTKAVLKGDTYIINGSKRYITNAPTAGIFTVIARTGAENSGAAGASAFVIERGTRGMILSEPVLKMGEHGSDIGSIEFCDCSVSAAGLIGGVEGRGFKGAMNTMDFGRLFVGASAVGIAERVIEETVKYALSRKQFGQPLADFELIQGMLADSKTEWLACRALVLEASRAVDKGEKAVVPAAAAKYFVTETLARIADRAVQIAGGYGFMHGSPMERYYRDARGCRIYEGTNQIMQLVIARELIKEMKKAADASCS